MTFSARLPVDLTANRLTVALASERRAGRSLLDLTQSNPTLAKLTYPPDMLACLGDARALTYTPAPLGLETAREAVAADYARRGLSVPPCQIVLTASTSEAYALLFKILCDPGDEVLVPRPSYPLFDHLTRLEGVRATTYDLEYQGTWLIDCDSLERSRSNRTRAVLLVSPNNPTGSFVTPEELDRIAIFCSAHDLAIIADEVFAEYELVPGAARVAGKPVNCGDALTFSLGGLSKSIGLPQVKLGWIVVAGPAPLVIGAIGRLELAADTYLSVSTPVQTATAELLARGAAVRQRIHARVTANLAALVERTARVPSCQVLRAEGGWYAVVQVPTTISEEELVLRLLTEDGVLVHPGYFFDFASESFLVVSLLAHPADFTEGIERVLKRVGRA